MNSFSDELLAMAAKSSRKNSSEWLPFWMHSMDTAGILKKLYRRWVPVSIFSAMEGMREEDIEKLLVFLGLIHDIGKLTAVFQSKLMPCIDEQNDRFAELNIGVGTSREYYYATKSPHSLAGEAILLEAGCPEGVAAVVGSHHGKPTDLSDNPQENIEYHKQNYFRRDEELWRDIWGEWLDFSLDFAGYTNMTDIPVINMSTQLLLSGLLIMGDWIASNTFYFPMISIDEYPECDCYPERVNKAYRRLQFPDRWMPQMFSMGLEDFKEQFGFLPNEMQKVVLDIATNSEFPGMMIIEAHMGNGKTEAALAAAEVLASRNGSGGIYFGLPSQATANGLFPRIKKWAEEQSWEEGHTLELLHGAAALNEAFQILVDNQGNIGEDIPDEGVYVHKWFEGGKTGLLADFAIGTIDQLLMAALKKKHVMLRILGLAGKVVVIDECHAYDAYMNQYLDRVLNWLGRYCVPVILLSATLPSIRREELVKAYIRGKNRKSSKNIELSGAGYPLITWTEGLNVFQREICVNKETREIIVSRIEEENIIETLKEKLKYGGCAGVIVNTVRYAQLLTEKVKNELSDYEVILFHSRFTMTDRAEIEKKILDRIGKTSTFEQRNHFIVIGTQVLEQSLDIDFDFLITQLAPMDLLLQRIGRLHRHDRVRSQNLMKAECMIIENQGRAIDEGSNKIYGGWLLHQTLKTIPDSIQLPLDIPDLVGKVYSLEDNNLDEDEKELLRAYKTQMSILSGKATEFCIKEPSESMNPVLNTITGLLDTSITENSDAEAAVRDGDGTIEVILMIRKDSGNIAWFPWQDEGRELSGEYIPYKEDVLKICKQKIRLPGLFNYKWHQTITELKNDTIKYLKVWQEAPVLKGELFLLLNEQLEKKLVGYTITYSNVNGLMIVKDEGGALNGENL